MPPFDSFSGPSVSPPAHTPFPNVAQHVPASTSQTHLLVLNGQRGAGLSPLGARQSAAGQPLTSLGDQTRVIHLQPGSTFRPSTIPSRFGDEAGVAGGASPGGYSSGMSPTQFKFLVPR